MAGPNLQETFTTGAAGSVGNISDVLVVPTGVANAKLTTVGLDANNTIKTQKRVAGGAWADQVTYNAEQNATVIAVATGEEWRLVQVTQQVSRDVRYKFSCES